MTLPGADPPAASEPPALALRGLRKVFGATVAVDRVDLDVPRGSFFGLVGPNGAGKTTTLSMATGLLRPDFGTAFVDGYDVWGSGPVEAKRRVGILPDGQRMLDRLSGRELLTYTGLLRGMPPEVIAARSTELLEVLDLTGAGSTLVVDYSAGMLKKIGLAAALLHSPRLLVLDEPFEAVDPVSGGAIRTILQRYVEAGGTVIFSSHVMELVERLCDHVAVIAAGRVLTAGRIDDVRAGRSLEEVFVGLVGGRRDTGEGLSWLGTSLRLRWRVFVNSVTRGNGTQRWMSIIGTVLGVVIGLAVAIGFVTNRGGDSVDDLALIFVGLFGVGWLALPVLLFGTDNTIDPMRFSLLPLRPGDLVRGQLAAGLIGAPTIFGVLTLGAAAYAISDSAATFAVALVAAVLTLLLCQVGSRALTTSIGGALRSRRGKDFALLGAALLAASIYPLQIFVQTYLTETGRAGVGRIAEVVSWLPFGWPFAAVLDARDGDWTVAAGRLVGTLALCALLGWLWSRAVVRTLEGPEAAGSSRRAVSGELVPRWARPVLPGGAVGAVAAKELRYWWRDPRRRAAALTSLFVGVGIVAVTAVEDGSIRQGQLAYIGLPVAFFATMNCANQFGLDGTAIWSTIAAPGSASADIAGRQLGVAMLALPVCVVLSVAGTLVGGAATASGAAAMGLCLAAIGAGLGTTTVMAVVGAYPVPENPSNPFAGGGAGGFGTAAYQFIGLLSQLAVLLPVGVLVIWGLVGDRPTLLWTAFVVGPLWGATAAWVGRRIGTGLLERRGPEVLLAVTPRG